MLMDITCCMTIEFINGQYVTEGRGCC